MIHWLVKTVLIVTGNAFALWLAAKYIPAGFVLSATWYQLAILAIILTLLNLLVKPVLKLALGPIIVLTLGLGIIIVNAIILYALPIVADHLDILRGSISIETIPALLYATLIVSAVNLVIHLTT
jgi:putative membrane protein